MEKRKKCHKDLLRKSYDSISHYMDFYLAEALEKYGHPSVDLAKYT